MNADYGIKALAAQLGKTLVWTVDERVHALASWPDLNSCDQNYPKAEHEMLRAPEIGLAMLRGRRA